MHGNKQRPVGEEWNALIELFNKGGLDSSRMVGPIVDVADTMDACRTWFESYRLPFVNTDLIAMTRLILERLDEKVRQEERREDAND
jgi:hypothetical protein